MKVGDINQYHALVSREGRSCVFALEFALRAHTFIRVDYM